MRDEDDGIGAGGWDYRIVRYEDGSGVGLHEVYYDAQHRPRAMTERPVEFIGENAGTVRGMLADAMRDAVVLYVLDETEIGSDRNRKGVRST